MGRSVRRSASPSGAAATRRSEGSLSPGEALLAAFRECRDELISTLMFLLGNQADAEDAAQDAFLKCWRTQESLNLVRNFRAWIFRVALNTAKDLQRSAWHRKTKPLVEGEAMRVSQDDLPAATLEQKETMKRLRDAVLTLRPEEQEIFLLRQNGELTYEEIAELRQTPVGTVKTQMRSALQKLRRILA